MSARPTGKGKGKERPGAKALFRQLPRTFGLVLQSDGKSFGVVVGTTLLGALVPAAMAYVAKLIVDSVVRAQQGGAQLRKMKLFRRLRGVADVGQIATKPRKRGFIRAAALELIGTGR